MLEIILLGLMCICKECDCEPPPNFHQSCPGPQKWSGGNLWKPQGESDGRLVVLLRTNYPVFESCEVRRKDGGYEELVYTGLSNGDRQTYRGAFSGGSGEYAGKKKDGGVRCWIEEFVCTFPIPGPPKQRWE